MKTRFAVMVLFLAVFAFADPGLAQTCRGFERSQDHRGDTTLDAVRGVLAKHLSTGVNEFEFVRAIADRFYVFTGSAFLFVDTFGNPWEHYVSPLFQVDDGRIEVLWYTAQPARKAFLISYEGKRNDGTPGKHAFYLDIPSDDPAWCNDVIGLEVPEGTVLRHVRFSDVDHDGLSEMLCSFDPIAPGPRMSLLFKQEEQGDVFSFVPWKPTYTRAFFDTLFKRADTTDPN
ncbi:MAG TPA: hypothetical protein PLP29_00035 [Candidatus Ozemobacteraceae bacterium]|nr:hypothetical protein [Candidatus Ozemobacteraceae bacterium]